MTTMTTKEHDKNNPANVIVMKNNMSMSDTLDWESPIEYLRAIASSSRENADTISMELTKSLNKMDDDDDKGDERKSSMKKKKKKNKKEEEEEKKEEEGGGGGGGGGIPPLPQSILQTSSSSSTTKKNSSPSQMKEIIEASKSIHKSLSTVATVNSQASTELRHLESERRTLDHQSRTIERALKLRRYSSLGAEALGRRNYEEAVDAICKYRDCLEEEEEENDDGKDEAEEMAGVHTVRGYQRTSDVLENVILDRYDEAIQRQDVGALGELTPLLGLLGLAHRGIVSYMKFSRGVLKESMDLEEMKRVELDQEKMRREDKEGLPMSRAEQRRREARRQPNVTVCGKLAKVYNAAVTHLRHHLPMVTFALGGEGEEGEESGDAALVRVVHEEVERRAVEVMKEYVSRRDLEGLERRAERVGSRIEERYVSGMADEVVSIFGTSTSSSSSKMNDEDDCGFLSEVGSLSDVDAAMDELALLLQHTESYERFIRHAVQEVMKARDLRRKQKREERRRKKELEEARLGDDSSSSSSSKKKENREEDEDKPDKIIIIPAHSQLNQTITSIASIYTTIERTLLLASMQNAFHNSSNPTPQNYSPLSILPPSTTTSTTTTTPGCQAMQTSLVEQCLYSAQRCTLRAFATGHVGTASAAANECVHVLGSVVSEVLIRHAELAATTWLKPGEGGGGLLSLPSSNMMTSTVSSLLGQGGGGVVGGGLVSVHHQAAFAAMRDAAGKAGRKMAVGGQVAGKKGGSGGNDGSSSSSSQNTSKSSSTKTKNANNEVEVQRNIQLGISRATASINDLEVTVHYLQKLESRFLSEIESGFPKHARETHQLILCVGGLKQVMDSYRAAADRVVELLAGTIMGRVRGLVNDAVGTHTSAAAASGASGTNIAAAGAGSGVGVGVAGAGVVGFVGGDRSNGMNYNLDDYGYDMSQVAQGYMVRLCAGLDELIEPLRIHLAPRLSDALLIAIIGGASKRLESSIKRTQFTALGALALDSDIRHFINYSKLKFDSPDLTSNLSLYNACTPLARLAQIAHLMNVDDLEDVLDLISASKRNNQWDLELDDAKAFLGLRVEFEGRKVNELLNISSTSTMADD